MENSGQDRIWELISRKLSNEASKVELLELQELLQKQPEEAYSLEIMEDLWRSPVKENKQYTEHQYKLLTQKMAGLGIDTSGFQEHDEHLIGNTDYKESWFKRKKRLSVILASTFAITVISVLAFSTLFERKVLAPITIAKKSEISTKYGSKTTLVLPDGTKVWVNAGSKLAYDESYGVKLREVSLLGEAFFDVVKNSEKPFIIHTDKMDIKVLGTAFNVRCYPNEKKTETSLIRGRIEVTIRNRPTEKIYLNPNEKLTLLNDEIVAAPEIREVKKIKAATEHTEPLVAIGHLTYEPVDNTVIETSWVDNKLVFRGETFEEVALKMERWYGVKITIADESLRQAHLTGSFELETVDQALAALQITTRFKFFINKNSITITK